MAIDDGLDTSKLSSAALETLAVFVEAETSFRRCRVTFTADVKSGWIVIDHVTTEDGVVREIVPPVAVATLTQ